MNDPYSDEHEYGSEDSSDGAERSDELAERPQFEPDESGLMPDFRVPPLEADEPRPAVRRRRGHPIAAWFVILVVVVLSVGNVQRRAQDADNELNQKTQLTVLELQSRIIVGAASLGGPEVGDQFVAQAEMLNQGSLRQRLCYVILVGELQDPAFAQETLTEMMVRIDEQQIDIPQDELELAWTLQTIYADFVEEQWETPNLVAEREQQFRDELGWFAELALAPAGSQSPAREPLLESAQRACMAVVFSMLLVFAMGIIGLGTLVYLIVQTFSGQLRSRLHYSLNGGIYAETFAVWMVLFMALSIGVSALAAGRDWGTVPLLAISGGSLLALVWPLVRKVALREVLADLGLNTGRRWYVESICGLMCYLATLPVLALIFILIANAVGLAAIPNDFSPHNLPAHPVISQIREATLQQKLGLLLLAAVCAPIVEEIMFRGVLYRHLREATRGVRMSASILISSFSTSLLFAVIHPQGWVAVPALSTLAVGFSVAREWRGSLVAPITAHALNNFIVITIAMLCLS